MSGVKIPTLADVVEKWRSLLNRNAQDALGPCDMEILVGILGTWIDDTTEPIIEASRNTAWVGPDDLRRFRGVVQVAIHKLREREE